MKALTFFWARVLSPKFRTQSPRYFEGTTVGTALSKTTPSGVQVFWVFALRSVGIRECACMVQVFRVRGLGFRVMGVGFRFLGFGV